METLKVGIIGSGNIGTDLMVKLRESKVLNLTTMMGVDPSSRGMKYARKLGLHVFDNGIDGLIEHPDYVDIIFDATSAHAHRYNAKIARQLGKKMVDLTPAAIGPFVIPAVNLNDNLDQENVNLITCGGQATIPIIHAINRVTNVAYGEIVATISSQSAGPGTRANIDEFTETTSRAIEQVGGAEKGKAIIILNPAEPPIIMRDTVHVIVKDKVVNRDRIVEVVRAAVKQVQTYVPGYTLRTDPLIEEKQITVFLQVEGAGHYLPTYAGNLDIMTSAAKKVAEEFAEERLRKVKN
ncbi:acetaldehyde dehydrogenase (acetylating) [Virgibacillus pantothenticus]|uniref:acetaldehyde dehydrogenase (acetylating) n=1 Tax=Virgibacillus TaxID=84406 RepID=UPI000909E6B8|nr:MULTISPECIES: acetaldehyde dehydrogenase (acetylating) [Virgibacillus]API92023.1 acetaldehyde dehydrogenase (acetylating) [Virgibacillus sp. 6R]MBS7430486.1 acetaldehyde dehydrogenase (acetylating) [Virgibacillus sp. 19R1-5]MBU8566424.1 acetaldehyde dehydrogenase (acetylating) [Virgibacillus pantothenticus]MBU8600161.1 acetaldehyde dehydrogenase (acetylating) [Virgibacillus pantothenticus]MBU8633907.1 acetaldehyde dehydrogenase (acetylating) [Virgibacillus pantothenticus]